MPSDTLTSNLKRQDVQAANEGVARRAYDNVTLLDDMLTGMRFVPTTATQTEIQAALTAVGTNGGVVNFDPRGVHDLTSALTLTIDTSKPVVVNFNGARLRATGSHGVFDTLEAEGSPGAMFSVCTINDLYIDSLLTSGATYGLKCDCKRALFNRYIDNTDTDHTAYRSVWICQTSYWNDFYSPWIRRNASGILAGSTGFFCDGHTNAFHIYGGGITKVENGIQFWNNGGFANGCSFHGATFETVTTGVLWDSSTSVSAATINTAFIGCRFEDMDVAFKTTANITGNNFTSIGNYYVSSVTAITDFAVDPLSVASFDSHHSGVGGVHTTRTRDGLRVECSSGSASPLEVFPNGGNRGLNIYEVGASGNHLAIRGQGAGENKFVASCNSFGGDFEIRNISGLSSNGSVSANFVGRATISGTSTSASVTFATEQVNADYYVQATPFINSGTPTVGTVVITNKATTGFTIEVDTAPGVGETLRLDWMIIGV